MKVVGLLSFRQPDERDPLAGLHSLAEECGVTIEEVRSEHFSPGLADRLRRQIRRLLDEAAGWIVVSEHSAIQQLDGLSLLSEFRSRILKGGRLFLSLPENNLDEANLLAAPFDVTGTDWRIRRIDQNDPYSLDFTRSRDHFREAQLLSGIDTVVFSAVSALWYAGNAHPVLSFGRQPEDESLVLVNGRTDFRVSDFTWQEVTPLVLSYTEHDAGLLAASSIGIISDSLTTAGGLTFPGIESNRGLARNILRFLTTTGAAPLQTARERLHSLEINLAEFVKCVGEARFGAEWWVQLVPEPERIKCAERQRGQAPPIAWLDLVDFRKIIVSNWDLFLPHLSRVLGSVSSRTQGLAWLDVIPNIRNTLAHPVREHFGEPIDESRRAAVYEAARIANELRRQAKGS